MARLYLFFTFFFVFGVSFAKAQVLGPSVREVKFSYTAEFVTDDNETSAEFLAIDHAQYLFGVLHSNAMTSNYGIDYDFVEGIGSPNSRMSIRIYNFQSTSDNRTIVKYQAWGKMLLHKDAADAILETGQLQLPLPYDMATIYDKKCTDYHYFGVGDYWYFWDPLSLDKCTYLSRPPHSTLINISISPSVEVNAEITPRLDLLRADNGNGKKLSLYVIHGFSESSVKRGDEGRINFNELNEYLEKSGFEKTIARKTYTRPLYVFTKTIQLPNGKSVDIELRHLLVETSIESNTVSFAKFFKEAVEEGDVIVYAGHSGLGANLNIPSLEEKAGEFVFNQQKRQIFYFDSCASYSYYLDQFSEQKRKKKIDVVTNALSSTFDTSEAVLEGLLEPIFSEDIEDDTWMNILSKMEEPLDGGSFLLSVGGI